MRKLIGWIVTMTLGVASLGVIILYGVGFYLSPQDDLVKSDVIVAVSGGETDSRAAEATRLYQVGWAPKLIFSGAAEDPHSRSNAAAMKALAVSKGVPENDIMIEELSHNTAENALATAQIIKARSYQRIILVTSPYHQRRADLLFTRSLGSEVEVLNHSTTDENWRRSRWWANQYSYRLTISELQKILFLRSQESRS